MENSASMSTSLTIPPATTAMVTLLDTNLSPGQFAGFSDLTSSTANSALHDLFGLHISSPNPPPNICQHNSTNYVYTQPHACTHVVDSFGFQPQYTSPCSGPDSLPNNYLMMDDHTLRRRKQALNRLTIPQENNWTTDGINSTPPINDCLCSASYLQTLCNESPFECCSVTLEDCFIMDADQSAVDHCGDISGDGVDERLEYCGELPLPPSVHAWMGKEEMNKLKETEKNGFESQQQLSKVNDDNVTETISSTASPMLSSNEHDTSDSCGSKRSARRGGRRRRRKRRRISTRNRLITTSSSSQGGLKAVDVDIKDKKLKEEQDGQDMLSCVYSNSEQEMRDSLNQTAGEGVFHATCTVITTDGTVEDGMYSPPTLRHSSTFPHQHKSLLAQ